MATGAAAVAGALAVVADAAALLPAFCAFSSATSFCRVTTCEARALTRASSSSGVAALARPVVVSAASSDTANTRTWELNRRELGITESSVLITVGKCVQEGDHVLDVHVAERGHIARVPVVRRGQRDVAQRRHLERAAQVRALRDHVGAIRAAQAEIEVVRVPVRGDIR